MRFKLLIFLYYFIYGVSIFNCIVRQFLIFAFITFIYVPRFYVFEANLFVRFFTFHIQHISLVFDDVNQYPMFFKDTCLEERPWAQI